MTEPLFIDPFAWGVFAVGCWTLFSWALGAGTRVANWLENRQNRA